MPTMTRAGYTPPKEQPPKKKPEPAKKPGKKKKKKAKRANGAVIASLAIFALAAVLGAGTIYVYTQTQPYQNAFVPGTMLMGYPLAGATQESALALIDTLEQERVDPWQMEISCMGQSYTLTAQDVSLEIDAQATLAPLWAAGREGGMIARYIEMLRLSQEPLLVITPTLRYDMGAVDALLEIIRADVECEPMDATIAFRPGSAAPFAFMAEETGYSLDVTGVRREIEESMQRLTSASVTLEATELAPKAYQAVLEENITLRGDVTMQLDADANALANVRLAAGKLHGLRIEPGEALSFNERIGARTEAAGYLVAGEPAYGADVSGVGGGVCQLSTALYRAALMAGLTIEERHAAVRPVAYCDMGQEAAVSDQGLDLRIANPTDSPLFVTTRVYEDGGAAWLEIMLIGAPQNARYALKSHIEETGLIAEPVYIRDREGKYAVYSDERVPVGEALVGYRARVERVRAGQEDAGETVSESVYEAVPPTIYVGMKDREE